MKNLECVEKEQISGYTKLKIKLDYSVIPISVLCEGITTLPEP
jgi:hypothetical protein